jgi:hypothetical protein
MRPGIAIGFGTNSTDQVKGIVPPAVLPEPFFALAPSALAGSTLKRAHSRDYAGCADWVILYSGKLL